MMRLVNIKSTRIMIVVIGMLFGGFIQGGHSQEITSFQMSPVMEQMVVGRYDGNIVLTDLNVSNVEVLCDGISPNWSPDGNKIAFVRYDVVPYGTSIWIHDVGSGSNTQLTPASDKLYHFSPDWSRDGSTIIYSNCERVWSEEYQMEIYDNSGIYSIPAEGGTATRLTPPLSYYMFDGCQYSYDGRAILYKRRENCFWGTPADLWIYTPEDNTHSQLTGSIDYFNIGTSWTPCDDRLLMGFSHNLVLFDIFDGTTQTMFSGPSDPPAGGFAWRADGSEALIHLSSEHGAIFISTNLDLDGDNICDSWEGDDTDTGIPYFAYGTPYRYQLEGSDPHHKDLFVEIDCMETIPPGISWEPSRAALDQVEAAFAAVPLEDLRGGNPDYLPGINLHCIIDENTIPYREYHANPFNDSDFYMDKNMNPTGTTVAGYFGTVEERSNLGVILAKQRAYRYCIYGRTLPTPIKGNDNLGTAESSDRTGCNDFLIDLQQIKRLAPVDSQELEDEEAIVFMHELGHALGLGHGGGDHVKFKPNYFSVMNPALCGQFNKWKYCGRLDYSHEALPTIDKTDLNEQAGLQGEVGSWIPVGPAPIGGELWDIVQLSGPIDWNDDGDPLDEHVAREVNDFGYDLVLPTNQLDGYDDWENIVYFPIYCDRSLQTKRSMDVEDEICVQLHEYMEELEFDCNDNGISDSDDIEFGTSSDDNGNGIPDECEEEASSTPDERQPEPSQIQLSIKPNPSHGENTTISLVLKEETSLSVDIYDASGRLVRNIIDQSLPADIHHLNWDGQDEHGLHAVTGIYFIRVVTEKDSYSKQLTLRR